MASPPTPRKLNYLRRYLFLRWSGEFDVDSYLLANPDVLVAGVNPLMHYVQYGRAEGRQPFGGDQQHRSPSSRELKPPPPAIGENSALHDGIAPDAAPPLTADPDLDHVEEARSEASSPEDTEAVGSSDATVDLSDDGSERATSSRTTILTDDLRKALESEFDPEYYRGVHDDIERDPGSTPLSIISTRDGARIAILRRSSQRRTTCLRTPTSLRKSSIRWFITFSLDNVRGAVLFRPLDSSARRSRSSGRSTRRLPIGTTAWPPQTLRWMALHWPIVS